MSINKIPALLLITLWYLILGSIFMVIRPELAYSYGHWLGEFSGNLPRLTESFSLPVLGPAISSVSQSYSAIFFLVWGFVLLPPLLLLYFVLRRKDSGWVAAGALWSGVYLLLSAILMLFVAFGLWLPSSAA